MSAGPGPDAIRPRRRDHRRSRDAILAAVAALLAELGTDFTLPDVARRAEVATATVYRHFASVDEAISAYYGQLCTGLIEAFDAIPRDLPADEAIRRLCLEWTVQAAGWGPAAVYLRSPRGFLDRLAAADPFITSLCRHLETALSAAIAVGLLPHQDLRYAALIWATLFDERVVIDLTHGHGMAPAEVASRLTATLLGALRTGSEPRPPFPDHP